MHICNTILTRIKEMKPPALPARTQKAGSGRKG